LVSIYTELFNVSRDGGLAEALPLPMAFTGAYSGDGQGMVYQHPSGASGASAKTAK
jgi:hypothetical protein